MRWKLVLTVILILAVAVAGGAGWFYWSDLQRQCEVARQLEISLNQIKLGQHERAQTNLERILAENPRLEGADAIWSRLAESYRATGDAARAALCWDEIIGQFPGSPHASDALASLAEKHLADGKDKDAKRLWDLVLTNFPGGDAVDDALYGQARLLYEQDDVEEARAALIAILDEYPDSDRAAEIEQLVGHINIERLYTAADVIYRIKRGDTLDGIGKQNGISPDLIAKANNIKQARGLVVGRRLKIPKADFSIEVNKSDNTLLLLNGGEFFKRYRARTGKEEYLTPVGTFHIQRKVKNPVWNDPLTGRTVPANDPENALGTRWLAFDGSIGIHGTNDPKTIGQYASNGCVGLAPRDVEELYDLVPIGTKVTIKGKMKKKRAKKEIR